MRPKNNTSSDLWFIFVLCILNSSLLKFPVWQYCDKPNDTSSADTLLAKYVGFDQVVLGKQKMCAKHSLSQYVKTDYPARLAHLQDGT